MSITYCKVNVEFTRGLEGEKRYSCTLTLISALDGVGGQRHTPAALPGEKRTCSHFVGGRMG